MIAKRIRVGERQEGLLDLPLIGTSFFEKLLSQVKIPHRYEK